MPIKWTKEDVIKAFKEALKPNRIPILPNLKQDIATLKATRRLK